MATNLELFQSALANLVSVQNNPRLDREDDAVNALLREVDDLVTAVVESLEEPELFTCSCGQTLLPAQMAGPDLCLACEDLLNAEPVPFRREVA